MDGLRIIPVTNEELIFSVSALADEIWHEHFSSILSTEQIDYMLEKSFTGGFGRTDQS